MWFVCVCVRLVDSFQPGGNSKGLFIHINYVNKVTLLFKVRKWGRATADLAVSQRWSNDHGSVVMSTFSPTAIMPISQSCFLAKFRGKKREKQHKEKTPLLCGGVVQRPPWGVTIVYCHCFLFRPIITKGAADKSTSFFHNFGTIFSLLKEITWYWLCWSLPDESLIFWFFLDKSNHSDTFHYKGILPVETVPAPLSWTQHKAYRGLVSMWRCLLSR